MHLHSLYYVIQYTILWVIFNEKIPGLFQIFKGEIFMNHQKHLVIKVFSKHFEGKISQMEIDLWNSWELPPKKPQYYNTSLLIYYPIIQNKHLNTYIMI